MAPCARRCVTGQVFDGPSRNRADGLLNADRAPFHLSYGSVEVIWFRLREAKKTSGSSLVKNLAVMLAIACKHLVGRSPHVAAAGADD